MKCPSCNYENLDNADLCAYCGQSLRSAPKSRQTVMGAPPPPVQTPQVHASPPRPPIDKDDPFERSLKPHPPAPRVAGPRDTVLVMPAPTAAPTVVGLALVLEPGKPPRAALIYEGRNRIGRNDQAELVLADPTVSAQHAVVRMEGAAPRVSDQSANGTWVGERHIHDDATPLKPGEVIRVGDTRIAVVPLDSALLASLRNNP